MAGAGSGALLSAGAASAGKCVRGRSDPDISQSRAVPAPWPPPALPAYLRSLRHQAAALWRQQPSSQAQQRRHHPLALQQVRAVRRLQQGGAPSGGRAQGLGFGPHTGLWGGARAKAWRPRRLLVHWRLEGWGLGLLYGVFPQHNAFLSLPCPLSV